MELNAADQASVAPVPALASAAAIKDDDDYQEEQSWHFEKQRDAAVAARLRAFLAGKSRKLGDAPPKMPRSEWRKTGADDWALWDKVEPRYPGARSWRFAGCLSPDEWVAIKSELTQPVGASRPESDNERIRIAELGAQDRLGTGAEAATPARGVAQTDRESGVGNQVDGGQVEAHVQPVPQSGLRLVQPVPQRKRKGRFATGSTRQKRANVQPVPQSLNLRDVNELRPPSFPGCKWKPSGLTGWELYTRSPSISENGKRSSKHKYVAYYSQDAIRRLHDEKEKTANLRRA